MSVVYLAALVVSLGCVLLVDRRYRLFLWHAPKDAAVVLAVGLAFLLAWDLAGIGLGIFFRAETELMTGVLLAPELPLEEPVFLLFLCELAMVLVCGASRLLDRRKDGGA
ncbi:lycopene cyclase domain-containing protein [Microbacterium betulae]|uniref:Lycopene cyclase domain-containing protein n=1 Tax=Microbacterium betulae TaxID=2981139 RepID=A0AA97I6R0_9MICO|nr:lycopene cyclase domain-containing protein [Microbacterium sp. AB]WOF22665.1 lycopene cyclase domain-containing protein [Microbacterium sp. AB]